jgi:hypothetical protein
MLQAMNRKPKLFLGMTGFQVGILSLLGLLTCGIIGLLGFFIFNRMTGNQISGFNFPSPSGAVAGKWELDSGVVYEFFPDGTVNMSGFFPIASTYSFPDKTHIKIETGQLAVVYEYTLSGDELTLVNDASVLTFKKYAEFKLDAQVVAGTWNRSSPDKSECFKGSVVSTSQEITLGADKTPQEITFGVEGSFSLFESGYYNFLMNGQYTVYGDRLHITASGAHEDTGVGIGGIVIGTPVQIQVQRDFDCAVIVSNSRLIFKDALGQNTVFVRAGR